MQKAQRYCTEAEDSKFRQTETLGSGVVLPNLILPSFFAVMYTCAYLHFVPGMLGV